MSCQIKNIPQEAFYIVGTGNRGGGFPKEPVCEPLEQPLPPSPTPPPVIEECYLSMELSSISASYGPDQTFGPILLVGNPTFDPLGPYPVSLSIFAPCVVPAEECYLALEENASVFYELEQTEDNFLVTCLQ